MKTGALIVIEGIDGSGKTTQLNLLKQYLSSQGQALESISFPRYGENTYANLISWYLTGEFGQIGQVDPYFLALAYAGDRLLAKPVINQWLNEGKTVLINRYVSSSKAHLGASLPEDKKEEFIRWLDELEYQTNNMPQENLTILLTVDPKMGQKNLSVRHSDIHEKSLIHLEEANQIYLGLAKENNWCTVNCMKEGQMRQPQDIHQELVKCLGAVLNTA